MWNDLFARILWIPLRELKKDVYKRHTLGEAFLNIHFKDLPDGKTFADALWNTVKYTNRYGSLFVLDGLDEVLELFDSQHRAFNLLRELLNSPNVVITTRPHARLPNYIEKLANELETTRFYPDQVHTYVEKVVQDPTKAEEIWSFLQKHQLIQSLVRIPIQLDALCLIWDENFKNNPIPETMTAVYQAIVQRLWKKDILRLNKLTGPSVDMASNAEIEERTETETKILEYMAFSGMYNNVVEFQLEHRDGIRKLATTSGNIVFDEVLGKLSFLRSSDPSASMRQRDYHFLHLTFQEFFAAKYFARQWEAGNELEYQDFKTRRPSRIKPDVFLKEEKYTGRYDIMWRFTVGMLSCDKISEFFGRLEEEPIDLLGPTHQRLVMHCLSEASDWESELRSDLESRLSRWLLVEQHLLRHENSLAAESEFPDGALISALESSSSSQKESIIEPLGRPGRHLSEAVIAILLEIIKDIAKYNDVTRPSSLDDPPRLLSYETDYLTEWRHDVAVTAAKALSYQPKISEAVIVRLSNEYNSESYRRLAAAETEAPEEPSTSEPVIKAVMELFETARGKIYAQHIAFTAMGNLKNLSEAAITACLGLIEYNTPFQRSAAMALKWQKSLSMATIAALVKFIQNESNNNEVQSQFIEALEHQLNLPETAISSLVDVFENKCNNAKVRSAAAYALGRQPNLSEIYIIAFLKIIEDECAGEEVRNAVADALGSQSNLTETVLAALVNIFEDECHSGEVRCAALRALENRPNLSGPAVSALINIFENECNSGEVRCAAIRALRAQPNLSEAAILALLKILEDKCAGREIIFIATFVLERQTSLSKTVVSALVNIFEDECNSRVARCAAVRTLGPQWNLPESVVAALARGLEANGQNYLEIQATVAWALSRQNTLPETAIKGLEMRF